MNDTPTVEARRAIVRAAIARRNYIRWLARMLLETADERIRGEAARELLQLIGDDQ